VPDERRCLDQNKKQLEKIAHDPYLGDEDEGSSFRYEANRFCIDYNLDSRENREISGSPPEMPSLRFLFLHGEHDVYNTTQVTVLKKLHHGWSNEQGAFLCVQLSYFHGGSQCVE